MQSSLSEVESDRFQASERRRRDLQAIVWEGAAYHVMVGAGESYFAAFCLAVGGGELAAGLVATVPLVLGATGQLVTPWGLRWIGSHRRWVAGCVALQALALLPLVWGALRQALDTRVVFAAVACYFGAGLASAPAWSTWAGRLVPARYRASYFARRTRLGQACLLASFLAAGMLLHSAAGTRWLLTAFAFTFGLAAAARLVSSALLASQTELPAHPLDDRSVGLRNFWAHASRNGNGRLLVYLLSVQAVVQISGPFFTPYMLKQLKLPYLQFALLTACAYLAKVLSLPTWGRLAHRYGAPRLLWLGGVAVTPIAGLWLLSQSLPFLMGVQILSGLAWAALELAIFLLFFETVEERQRTGLMTSYNFFHAWATLLGSLAGAGLIGLLGRHPEAYRVVFAVSALGRAFTLLLLVSVVPSVWLLELIRRPRQMRRTTAGPPTWLRIARPADDPVEQLVDAEQTPTIVLAPAAIADPGADDHRRAAA